MNRQEFATKGGSRVFHQFQEALLADEKLRPLEGHHQRSHVQSKSHDPYRQQNEQGLYDPRQRSHDQHQRSYSASEQHHRSHDASHDHQYYHQRSHYQRSHDQHLRSHDLEGEEEPLHKRSHEDHQRSHDHRQRSPQHFKYDQPHPHTQDLSSVVEAGDYPLPDSPAPPPYKSPSPDSEQAQVLQQLQGRQQGQGRRPHRQQEAPPPSATAPPPPRSKYAYHPGALGMGPEPSWTDLSLVDDFKRGPATTKQFPKPQRGRARGDHRGAASAARASNIREEEEEEEEEGGEDGGRGVVVGGAGGGVGGAGAKDANEEEGPDLMKEIQELDELMGAMTVDLEPLAPTTTSSSDTRPSPPPTTTQEQQPSRQGGHQIESIPTDSPPEHHLPLGRDADNIIIPSAAAVASGVGVRTRGETRKVSSSSLPSVEGGEGGMPGVVVSASPQRLSDEEREGEGSSGRPTRQGGLANEGNLANVS